MKPVDLIHEAIDGDITQARRRKLDELLETSPKLRREYRRLMRIKSDLCRLPAVDRGEDLTDRVMEKVMEISGPVGTEAPTPASATASATPASATASPTPASATPASATASATPASATASPTPTSASSVPSPSIGWRSAVIIAAAAAVASGILGFYTASRVRAPRELALGAPVMVIAESKDGADPADRSTASRTSGPRCMAESKVRFTLRAPKASSVVVVGDFNGWSKSSTPLTDEDGDGIWTVSVPLEPGIYQYNFLVDGKEWRSDPAADGRRRDGFGGYNSVLRI